MSAQLFKVRLNDTDAIRAIDQIGARAPIALARAINRAADSGRVAMARAIADDTGLKVGAVKNEIKISRARSGDTGAQLICTGMRIPLIAFRARGPEPSRGRGQGVSYQLPSGRNRIPDAFIATMKNGHRGVFKRIGKSRLAITELFGPSLPHVFAKFMPIGQARVSEALTKNLQSEIRFALTR